MKPLASVTTYAVEEGARFVSRERVVGAAPGQTEFLSRCPDHADRFVQMLVTFHSPGYPLQNHCLFARQRDTTLPRTYANMEFALEPPGVRVGPWPGWRGIPPMPAVEFRTRTRGSGILTFQYWGDEFQTGCVRATATLRPGPSEEIVITSVDSRLVPVSIDYYSITLPQVHPAPLAAVARLAARHPCLLIRQDSIPALKAPAPGRRASASRKLRDLLASWERPLVKTSESKLPGGPEGLSYEDRVLVGAYLALVGDDAAHVVRGRNAYLDYVRVSREPGFEPLTIDTQSGEVLFILCVGYDWLYAHLSETERDDARRWLFEVADICWNHLGYERTDFAQAHFLGCGLGLLAFSLLFLDEHPRSREWGEYFHGVARFILSTLPPDGFFAHGINLWIYEFGFLLRWLELLRTAAGIDLWVDGGCLTAASKFRLSSTSPDGVYGLTMGDPQFRIGGDSWCHYLIASRTGSGEAQWLGDKLVDLPVAGVDFRHAPARRRVYEHLWVDDRVCAQVPDGAITTFDDGGQIFVRGAASLFTFRSGPPLGEHRYRAGLLGAYGHGDPCNGSFLLYAGGTLALSGPGPVYRRDTGLQNLISIDGSGQLGDSVVWLPDFIPPEQFPLRPLVRREGTGVAVTSNLTRSYLSFLQVRNLKRALFVEPDRFIAGVDEFELTGPRDIQWNLHSWGEFRLMKHGSPVEVTGTLADGSELRLIISAPSGALPETGRPDFVPAYPNDGTRGSSLRVNVSADKGRFVWVVLFAPEPTPVLKEVEGGEVQVHFQEGSGLRYDGVWLTQMSER